MSETSRPFAPTTERFDAGALVSFARNLLVAAGLEVSKAKVVAEVLVEADLLGHTTNGLALLPLYLADVESGKMTKSGEPRVVADFPAALTWDGNRLPGPWLTQKAIEIASERARRLGTATVVIRRSHHIACLAAYLRQVTEEGLMVIISCSDPTGTSVAPHGGRVGAFTPNPIAAGWPTQGDPVMTDSSQSILALGHVRRALDEGRRLPGPWAVGSDGKVTDDPQVFARNPSGALLTTGGSDHGHKGYAMALLVEALTAGLSGHGRSEPNEGWTGTVFVQVLDPRCFGGLDAFTRETESLARTCRATPPREGFESVRLPGEAGLAKRRHQGEKGVELYPTIMPSLAPWAARLGCPAPAPLA